MENVTNGNDSADVSTIVEGPTRIFTSVGAAIMLVFYVQGLLGNVWIILAIMLQRKMWNVTNIFIASLCINDLLSLGLIVVLIIDSYIWGSWTAGMVMCKLNPEFTVGLTGSSLWHTALIAIHRYIVVVHNQFYKRMSKRAYVCFVLVMARVIPVACTVPGFTLDTSGYVPKLLRCIFLPNQKGRIISVTIVQIIVPCAVVVLCYAFVFGFVWRVARQVQDSNMMLQREIQITKMFGVIFLMILLGFVPYAIVRNADSGNRFRADIYVIVTVFYGIATCSSPLVYGVMSKDIRCGCKKCLWDMVTALHLARLLQCLQYPVTSNAGVSEGVETNDMVTWRNTSPKLSHADNDAMKCNHNCMQAECEEADEPHEKCKLSTCTHDEEEEEADKKCLETDL